MVTKQKTLNILLILQRQLNYQIQIIQIQTLQYRNSFLLNKIMSSIRSFIPLDKLGQGTYSNVYKVRRVDDNEIYALKKVKLTSLTQKQKQNALNQVRILASIQSPNIIAYKEAFFDETLSVLCVVMQFADGGDLQKYIKSFTKSFKLIEEEEIWKAAQNILKGLQNLHLRGILHRDIKCANIFKSKGIYKLGDLNVSKVNGDKLAYTQTGTPYYASPQVWRDQPYDSKSDVWSFGCIIYEMASLKPPFNGKDMQDLFKNVQKGKLIPLSAHYSDDLWKFIQLCLQKDAKKRPTATQLLKYLKHHNSNINSGLKIHNPESNKLLKTIKLPNDLKKLNQALPTSKYRKSTIAEENQKKGFQQKKLQKQFKQNKSSVALQSLKKSNQLIQKNCNQYLQSKKNEIQNTQKNETLPIKNRASINKSAIYVSSEKLQSPSKHVYSMIPSQSYKSPKNKGQMSKIVKYPASQVRLSKKVESCLGYSQRLQKSERKPSTASKVEKIKRDLDIEINIKDLAQKLKKPISIPRTQKKQNIINNSHLVQSSAIYLQPTLQGNQIVNNMSYATEHRHNSNNVHSMGQNIRVLNNKYEALDNWRNKLLKKNRILSSNNHSKPSWG